MSEPGTGPRVPAEGSHVLPPRRRRPRIAALRRGLGRIPEVHRLYGAAVRGRRELAAVYHDVRARLASRRTPDGEREHFARQSVPLVSVAPPAMSAFVGADVAVCGQARAGALATALADRFSLYPPDANVRIVRSDALPAGEVRELAHQALLTGNLMHSRGMAPRPYDALELHAGAARLLALVAGPRDAIGPAAAGVGSLLASGEVVLVGDSAVEHDADLAWERLRVADPAGLVRRRLDSDAKRTFHFGREIALRGGRYLYQSVPSAGATGRRDSARRWRLIASLLERADVHIGDRVVCDVGCNAGMMLAAALADGARWGLGWDLPPVVARGRDLLLSLGFTRFELIGAEMDDGYPILDDVPAHLRPELDGALVLYLAIRHHIGFLRQLGEVPWRAMVYEGGELEGVDRLEESLADLRALCDFEIAAAVDFRDGETLARPVAILVRR